MNRRKAHTLTVLTIWIAIAVIAGLGWLLSLLFTLHAMVPLLLLLGGFAIAIYMAVYSYMRHEGEGWRWRNGR